jgi:hypothetical protein
MGSQGQQMQDKLQEMQTVAALRSALNQFRIKLTEMLIATLRSIGHLISRSSGH